VSVGDVAADTPPHIIRQPDTNAAREKAYKNGEDVLMACLANRESEAVSV